MIVIFGCGMDPIYPEVVENVYYEDNYQYLILVPSVTIHFYRTSTNLHMWD